MVRHRELDNLLGVDAEDLDPSRLGRLAPGCRSGAFRDVFDVGVRTGEEQVLLGSVVRVVVPTNQIGRPTVVASHLEDRGLPFGRMC